jgi:serine/threonine protein phosphatase PrpC
MVVTDKVEMRRDEIKMSLHDDYRPDIGLAWGVGETMGWKTTMEDAYIAQGSFPSSESRWADTALFAVFDGHGGASVSRFCAEHLADALLRDESSEPSAALHNSFLCMDCWLADMAKTMSLKDPAHPNKVGSTAVACLVGPDTLIVANAGDSRAVLSRNGDVVDLSSDHKPDRPDEKARIIKAGGHVRVQHVGDRRISRLNCSLAVSRGVGDLRFKKNANLPLGDQVFSCEPEMNICSRDEEDEFLVIACDGVWDVMSSQEVIDFIREHLPAIHAGMITPSDVVLKMFDQCISPDAHGYIGGDNMTMILVVFGISASDVEEDCIKEEHFSNTTSMVRRSRVESCGIELVETLPMDDFVELALEASEEIEATKTLLAHSSGSHVVSAASPRSIYSPMSADASPEDAEAGKHRSLQKKASLRGKGSLVKPLFSPRNPVATEHDSLSSSQKRTQSTRGVSRHQSLKSLADGSLGPVNTLNRREKCRLLFCLRSLLCI